MAGKQGAFWAAREADLIRLVKVYTERGQAPDFAAIAPALSTEGHVLTPSGASQAYYRLVKAGRAPRPVVIVSPARIPTLATASDGPDNFRAALEGLEPIRFAAPPTPKKQTEASSTVLVAGDFHFPLDDTGVADVFLAAAAELRPRAIVLNGDLPDMLAISKYPSDIRKSWKLIDERVSMHRFLKRLYDVTAKWPCEIVETEANHSGNGVASRWWRYLSNRLGELASLPDVAERLKYEAVWWPGWALQGPRAMRLAEHYEIVPGLIVLHGDIARKQGAYSARGMMDKLRGASVIHSHTHRIGQTGNRRPAIGSLPEGSDEGYEIGCMCRLDCFYSSAPDWAQGFAIVRHDPHPEATDYNVEIVRVREGRAVIGGVGRSYGQAA